MDRLGRPDGTSEREIRAARRKRKRQRQRTGIGQPPRSLSAREVLAILANRQEGICGLCRKPLGPLSMCNVDHKIPKSKGGTNQWVNLQATHISCNSRKGARFRAGEEEGR